MINLLSKTFSVLTPEERKAGKITIAAMFLVAAIDVAGIASVAPFLAVLGNPEAVHTNRYLAMAYDFIGATDERHFLINLGILTAGGMISATCARAFMEYLIIRFIHTRRHTIASRLFLGHLRQKYLFFLLNNTSYLTKKILSEVDSYIENALNPSVQIIAYFILSSAIICLLLVIDFVNALGIIVVFGGLFVSISLLTRGWLSSLGRRRVAANTARFKLVSEALTGIKELRMFGGEEFYYKRFEASSLSFATTVVQSQLASRILRYFFQIVGLSGIVILTIVLLMGGAEVGQILPMLGVYLVAGFRLLPGMYLIYGSTTLLRYAGPAIDEILEDLSQVVPPDNRSVEIRRLKFQDGISFSGVQFSYPGTDDPALSIDKLKIPTGSMCGIAGATGSGKSTFLDLILGLIEPQAGQVLIDGIKLKGRRIRAWQQCIGYVPQHIFLADDSILQNIALGVDPDAIDLRLIERAARVAQIHEFIINDLPDGYDTVIGERGSRLSGGQRQRLGIARALYHDPDVVVLDEGTNALDTATERQFMEAIDQIRGNKTIVLVAHRIYTLRDCDFIIHLNRGAIDFLGSYQSLNDHISA